MAKMQTTADQQAKHATRDDVQRIFSGIDDPKLLAIVELGPTIAELEEASLWLSGDADIFGPGQPLKHLASDIVSIITADEDDEESRSR
jgi:hypothetical protein